MIKGFRLLLTLGAVMLACLLPEASLAAQGKLEKVRVEGASLKDNLQGNDATRDVWVYLPPSYSKGRKRYPVVYFLHGYAVTADVYVNDVLKIPAATDEAMSKGTPEFIIVMPDAFTRFGGSWYSSSPTVGDWETFIAKELVRYIHLSPLRARLVGDIEVLEEGVIMIQCSTGYLCIDTLKPAGKQEMPAAAYLTGYKLTSGMKAS